MNKTPENRLGFNKGIIEIKRHPWCKDIKWKKILDKKIKPPLIPKSRESNISKEFSNIQIQEDFLLDEGNECGEFIENFEYYQEDIRNSKRNLSIIPEAFDYGDTSTKKSDDKVMKSLEFSEDSYANSSSLELEYPVKINQVPNFSTKFFDKNASSRK